MSSSLHSSSEAALLALRIPPLLLTVLAGLSGWAVAYVFPGLAFISDAQAWLAAGLSLLGGGCCLLAVAWFRQARTTINPMRPQATTALVTSGIFQVSRNPIYLGFLFLLLGELTWLGNVGAFLVAPAFVVYLNRFQIAPEERALKQRFGVEYTAYAARVRRWL